LLDPDPMVRIGALDMLANVSAAQIWPLVSPLLADFNRGVRIRAVALLAAVPTVSQPPADREPFEHAAAEFVAAQRLNADRPEARSMLGNFPARRGLLSDAEVEYKAAVRLSPQYGPAAINLADLYRQLGRDGDGETWLGSATPSRGHASDTSDARTRMATDGSASRNRSAGCHSRSSPCSSGALGTQVGRSRLRNLVPAGRLLAPGQSSRRAPQPCRSCRRRSSVCSTFS